MATAGTLRVNGFTIEHEDGLIKFRQGNAIPICIRDTDVGMLVELVDLLRHDRRHSRRIPVRDHALLQVSLRVDKNDVQVTGHDLSMAGVLSEVRQRDHQPLDLGQRVQITLRIAELQTSIDGVVVRRDEHKYGIQFVWDDSESSWQEMDQLRLIYHRVQRDWLIKSPQFSETLLEHARFPRNLGKMSDAHAVGSFSRSGALPFVTFYVRTQNGCIEGITFEAQGCSVAVAACSLLTLLVRRQPIADCAKIRLEDLVGALGGVPTDKIGSTEVVLAAFRRAIAQTNVAYI